jgi:hypothetical protein
LLLGSLALAQESEEAPQPEMPRAYDQALLRFNTHIQSYPSWEAFKAEALAKVPPGTPGTCYELTSASYHEMEARGVEFEGFEGDGWQQTSGQGWRLSRPDRTFTEYRINQKAGLLMRIEGYKPRFFFAITKRICEFGGVPDGGLRGSMLL